MVSLFWADVKYHVPTGFLAEGEQFQSPVFTHEPKSRLNVRVSILKFIGAGGCRGVGRALSFSCVA